MGALITLGGKMGKKRNVVIVYLVGLCEPHLYNIINTTDTTRSSSVTI